MKRLLLLTVLLTTQSVIAAPYYRFWRGEKLKQMPEITYMNRMAKDFVPMAPKLFPALDSYLVAIPPKGLGVDEVALLAYTNEEEYLSGRSTQEGRGYSDAHWELFERENSKSLVPGILDDKVEANKAYDLLNTNPDWSQGETYFFMGKKKDNLSTVDFLSQVDKHVRSVRKGFSPVGMKGYVVLITEDREYAWINWDSKASADKAYASAFGKSAMAEASQLMDILQWSTTSKFENKLKRGGAVHVNTKRPVEDEIIIDAH